MEKPLDLGLPAENIIAMEEYCPGTLTKALMEECHISLAITKESGEAGGTTSKIEATFELVIPMVMVMRPEVVELAGKMIFNDVDRG